MCRNGEGLDDAPMENSYAELTKELVHRMRFGVYSQAKAAVFEYIEVFNNRQRSLGSSFNCNTQSPLGLGCCDGHTKQAPQQRGPWRDISRA
jgi:hypothetical protein